MCSQSAQGECPTVLARGPMLVVPAALRSARRCRGSSSLPALFGATSLIGVSFMLFR
jgi:hypothetical protein